MSYGPSTTIGPGSDEQVEKNVEKVRQRILSGVYTKEAVLDMRLTEIYNTCHMKASSGNDRRLIFLMKEYLAIERIEI
jgi:hypothetical protein